MSMAGRALPKILDRQRPKGAIRRGFVSHPNDCGQTRRRIGREALERLLSWDFNKLIVAHGGCVDHDGKAFVANAFRWLNR